jgi:very-short-patch-repair endonuclease
MAVSTKLDVWQKDLIDTSRMNALLYYRSSGRGAGIHFQIAHPDDLFDRLVHSKRLISLNELSSTLKPEDLEKALSRLRTRARDDLNERGINTLYLVFGLLAWREVDYTEEVIRSPLVLVPVSLSREGMFGAFRLQHLGDEEIEINPTLHEKLLHDFKIELPTFAQVEEAFEEEIESKGGYTGKAGAKRLPLSAVFNALQAAVPQRLGWQIVPEVHLGRFFFQKLVMYQDLTHHRSEILAHPLLKALGGGRSALPAAPYVLASELDRHIRPHDMLEILDADSSQQEAIFAAKQGASFVLQGPPGTGKSQTIANIIAESLGMGRKVLFVSEKMAALEVVQERLHAAGLGEFCLDLHNPKADKKAFIQKIQVALSGSERPGGASSNSDWQRESDTLLRNREQLNEYVRELHQKRFALQQSAFEIYGKLAQLDSMPDCDFTIPHIEKITHSQFERMRQSLTELLEYVDVLDEYDSYPWRETLLTASTLGLGASIRDHFGRLSHQLQQVQAWLPEIRAGLGEGEVACTFGWAKYALERLERALQSPLPPHHWFQQGELQRVRSIAVDANMRCTSYDFQRQSFDPKYSRSFLQLDHAALLRALTDDATQVMGCLRSQGQTPQDMSIMRRQELDQHLSAACAALAEVAPLAAVLAETSYQQPPTTLDDIDALSHLAQVLLATPHPPEFWLNASQFGEIRATALDAGERYATCAKLRSLLQALYEPAYLELDLHALAQRFRTRHQSIFRFLRPQYHQDIKRLRSLLQPGKQRTAAQLEADLYQAVKLLDEEARLREQRVEHARALGRYFDGVQTDWKQVEAALAWTQAFHTLFGAIPPSSEVLRLVAGTVQALKPLQARHEQFLERWEVWQQEARYLAETVKFDSLLGNRVTVGNVDRGTLQEALQQFHRGLRAFWQTIDIIIRYRLPESVPGAGATSGASFTWAELCGDLQAASQIVSFETWLKERETALKADLGLAFVGPETDWKSVFSALDWVAVFLSRYPRGELPDALTRLMSDKGDEAERARLSAALKEARASLKMIGAELDFSGQVLPLSALLPAGKTFDEVTPMALRERVDFLLEKLPCLERWLTCSQRLQQCEALGLSKLIMAAWPGGLFPRNIVEIFERRFYLLWLDEVRRQSQPLKLFSGQAHERAIDLFRRFDERHKELAQQRLRSQLARRRQVLLVNAGVGGSEQISKAIADLRKEVQKKRHSSIRQIVRRVAPALLELKPCWMMSPLSVSQFLESGGQLFDLVIFDEASQVCPENAISAILRGRQLIVVGDSKQLPPTRFFTKTLADDDEDEPEDGTVDRPENERMESILDECLGAGFSERLLCWHYRSRHESLIAFSNHAFYQNRLLTFPSPAAEHRDGVRFEYVRNGVYDRGGIRTNRREAERVAQLVFEHMRKHPTISLGVVALSEAQQRAIREAIEEMVKRQPELRAWEQELDEENPSGFFVKNLESVQGDERDVIILSIGYGPDAAGRIHQNFGPVNKPGGERRLNVAVTRARQQMIVVASMRASDLPAQFNSPGAQTLRDYLHYAEHGPSVLLNQPVAGGAGTNQEAQFDSPFEEAVYQALTAKGLHLDTQVGCSGYRIDLAVRDPQRPGKYLLGIECDGRTYHSSATARDRDRLRQRHLEQMGWTIHRIWSSDWIRNPGREVTRVLDKLK